MSEVKKIATRDSYGAALVELAKDHPDVVVLDPACRRELSARELHQGDYTPYEGLEVQGWPRHVWARGRRMVTDGAWSGPEQGGTGPAA